MEAHLQANLACPIAQEPLRKTGTHASLVSQLQAVTLGRHCRSSDSPISFAVPLMKEIVFMGGSAGSVCTAPQTPG